MIGSPAMAGALFLAGAWAQGKATGTAVQWPDSLEALVAAPQTHKRLFENADLRLLEVVIQPGETEPLHGHRWPLVYAFTSPTPAFSMNYPDGRKVDYPRDYVNDDWQKPQCLTTGDTTPHSATNTDSFPTHTFVLEFKHMAGRSIMSMKQYPR
jgi:hypothetical protein